MYVRNVRAKILIIKIHSRLQRQQLLAVATPEEAAAAAAAVAFPSPGPLTCLPFSDLSQSVHSRKESDGGGAQVNAQDGWMHTYCRE